MVKHETASFLVTGRNGHNSVSFGVASAASALKKVRELELDKYATLVLDAAGRERSIAELKSIAESEARK